MWIVIIGDSIGGHRTYYGPFHSLEYANYWAEQHGFDEWAIAELTAI